MSGQLPAVAIDMGGTKIAAGIVEPAGRIVQFGRVATPRELDGEQLWRTLDSLIARVTKGIGGVSEVAGVGCGCGGPMEWPAGKVSPLNIPAWRSFPLRDRLAERFPGVAVRLRNDASCMVAGEHWRGAGRGHDNMLGIVVSTGVGAGLVLDGRLIDGATGNAGHIGHMVVDPEDGPDCECGGKGCLEAIARGPGLAAWAQQQGWRAGSRNATARDLADDAGRGHPVAMAAMKRAGRALGLAIASAAALCDLEVVAVGGGLSQAGSLVFDPLEETLRRYARLGFTRDVRVVPPALGQDAGLIGAAALIFAADRYWSAD
jgi:glucokinase